VITAVVPIESLENATHEFLRLGADVEILQPENLRDKVASVARSLAAIYLPA